MLFDVAALPFQAQGYYGSLSIDFEQDYLLFNQMKLIENRCLLFSLRKSSLINWASSNHTHTLPLIMVSSCLVFMELYSTVLVKGSYN